MEINKYMLYNVQCTFKVLVRLIAGKLYQQYQQTFWTYTQNNNTNRTHVHEEFSKYLFNAFEEIQYHLNILNAVECMRVHTITNKILEKITGNFANLVGTGWYDILLTSKHTNVFASDFHSTWVCSKVFRKSKC